MPRKPDFGEPWYEAQRLTVYADTPKWIEWESFPYDPECGAAIRLAARAAAIRAAEDCNQKHGWPVRVVHVEQIFTRLNPDA